MSLRIVGGAWRGRLLASAPGSRPTQELVREALFSAWMPRLAGARFLDLFAGSGCVGFEAVSRGAESCCFVESRDPAVRALEANARKLGAGDSVSIARLELGAGTLRLPSAWPKRFDLVFADPPYDHEGLDAVVDVIEAFLAAGGEAAVEHSTRRTIASRGLRIDRTRVYGESALTFLRAEEEA